MTKNLTGPCLACGAAIEFPADRIGQTTQCPHCGQTTELRLATPPQEPMVSRRLIIWTVTAVLILVFGLAAVLFALKKAENLAQRQRDKIEQPGKP
jgi:uncharacterized paraquat-inducible protein A